MRKLYLLSLGYKVQQHAAVEQPWLNGLDYVE